MPWRGGWGWGLGGVRGGWQAESRKRLCVTAAKGFQNLTDLQLFAPSEAPPSEAPHLQVPSPLAHPDHFGHSRPYEAAWGWAWLGDQETPPQPNASFQDNGKDYKELTICSSNVLQFSWKCKGFQRDPGLLV